jgi:CHAD domain-containing protein
VPAKTLQPEHSGTRGLRRVAHGFVQRAARRLAQPELSDEQVHDARKNLQKSRAALRLLRETLGERIYRRENTMLRDAARSLNRARDARVLAEALNALRSNGAGLQHDTASLELEHLLRTEQTEVQREMRENGALDEPRGALQQLARRSTRWRVGKGGWSDLGPAFRRIYRSGRQAMPRSGVRPDDAALHEWRKRTKYLRYALQMLEPMRPSLLSPLVKEARRLTECLGEHHDLSLLVLKARDFSQGSGVSIGALLAAIEQRQARLVTRALSCGTRLYRMKPKELTERLGRYWHSWRQSTTRH